MSAQTFDNFVGGSYAALTPNLAADTCINLYYESADSGTGKNRAALMGAPGLLGFTLLPTSPCRGVFVGEGGMFAVGGSVLYQVFADGSITVRGDVGDDLLHSPVQIFENGTQLMVISAGAVYVDGGGPGGASVPADWIEVAGSCDTAGTAVTWVSGYTFPADAVGQNIVISGVTYVIAVVVDSTHLTLASSAGAQTGAIWFGGGGPAPAMFSNGSGTVITSGTAVTWVSGSKFDASNVGNVFYIAGTRYVVASVTDSTHLVLTSSAGVLGSTFTGTCDTAGTAVAWVSGTTFNFFFPDQIITIAGTPYAIASITDATHLVLASTAPTASAAAFTALHGVAYGSSYGVTASCGASLDGYAIVAKPGTRQFNISAVNDWKSWNPLDFAIKEAYPDGIVALLGDHEQLWIFGHKTTEVWADTGASAFPFQRIPGAFVQMGCEAISSVTQLDGTVAWIGGDARGRSVAYVANGFIPTRISTHAIETGWAVAGAAVGDAVAFAYSDQGHEFWVISFPSTNKTWVYDATAKLWHQRGWWDGTGLNRVRGAFHGFVFDSHIVADWETGQLYYQSTSTYDDDGAAIYHERAAPHVSPPMLGLAQPSGTSANSPFQNNLTFYHRFLLDMEAGAGSGGVLANGFTMSWVNQTTVIVPHNLGTTTVCVEVFDTTRLVVSPESIKLTGLNTLTLTFGSPFSGSVMVIKGDPGTTSYQESMIGVSSATITHNLGTKTILVQVYRTSDFVLIEPETVTVINANQVVVTFPAAMNAVVVIIKGVYTAAWFGQTNVIATHNLGTTAVEVQVFDVSGLEVEPETMRVTGVNTVQMTFASAFNGYVVVWASTVAEQPFIILDWSDDGGHTFGLPHSTTTGEPGAYATRVIWRRLGKSRDRVFRVRYLAKGKVAFINAYLESTAGSA
jgi:hypothetical protein